LKADDRAGAGQVDGRLADDVHRLDIPAGKINSIDDLLKDPQLKAFDLFVEREHQTKGHYVEVRPLGRFSAAHLASPSDTAHKEEHYEEMARAFGVRLSL
jgi:crotonobetainyl-CoA:carnitine CoA-transferase CaiB-like acyl-CoA transferase